MSFPILLTVTGAIIAVVSAIAGILVWLVQRKRGPAEGKTQSSEIIVCADGRVIVESETIQTEDLAIR